MVVKVDARTRILARLHPNKHGRGLNIYNPYLQETGANALYVLFHDDNATKLIRGVRSLNLSGAVFAGSFETDHRVAQGLDELHATAVGANAVGFGVLRDEKFVGFYQGGVGLIEAIRRLCGSFKDKSLVIVGAGTVVKGLLAEFARTGEWPARIDLFNRTIGRAVEVAEQYDTSGDVLPLAELAPRAEGNILLNATDLGAPWRAGEDYSFTPGLVERFDYVVDVNFVPPKTQLIEVAERLKVPASPGHEMYMYQVAYVLHESLGIRVAEDVFRRIMLDEFKHNWS